MNAITIVTNNQYRPILSSYELPKEALKEFDYYNAEQLEQATFFRYRGQYHDLGNFVKIDSDVKEFRQWDAAHGNSWFSGILIKLSKNCEAVIVGSYYS